MIDRVHGSNSNRCLGIVTPTRLLPEIMLQVRTDIVQAVSESEAHRTIKVWRALWKKMAAIGYCHIDRDPSFLFVNTAPSPRQEVWHEGEVVRLIKRAWREGYSGLARASADTGAELTDPESLDAF